MGRASHDRAGRRSAAPGRAVRLGNRPDCDSRHPAAACTLAAMLPIRRNIQELQASRIRQVTLAGRGIPDLIPLWFGEGDEVTPAFIRDAAAAALPRGETFYSPNRGIPELRDAIQRYLHRIYRTEVGLDRIVVSASGMNALMIAVQCLVGAGDSAVV